MFKGVAKYLTGVLFIGCVLVEGVAETPVFSHGKIFLPVIIAVGATLEERQAGEDLARVLGKMSGLNWPVADAVGKEKRGLYVGRIPSSVGGFKKFKVAEDLFAPRPGEVAPDAFRVESRDGSIFIEGATPEATGYAVAWLLQHEGGVRWYAPGANGEVIPRRAVWTLPELHVVREPAYVSREITGLRSEEEKIWAQHNGLRSRLEFSHALGSVFTPSLAAPHPDWFPYLEGHRYRPASVDEGNWQPNLALPAVADYAAQAAAAVFTAEGGRPSFSLGINDTVRFDQSDETRTLLEPLRYFRGMTDYSPLVFTFMNRVAESVGRSFPHRYLGCLAYFWCENPPVFPVNRNVLPFVTTDRSQYYDRDYRAADLALMSRWGASGVQAYGLWEYAYGRGFVIPRNPIAALAESIREGWHRGARGYFAEVEPQWGFDVFKSWMLAQLLWEPDRPVDELAADFYHGYYSDAAEPMRTFFSRCEEQWMTQRGAPYWLKYYKQEDQAGLFGPETCRELRGWLEKAASAVNDDPRAAARVAQASRAFAVTEAYVKFDSLRRAIASVTSESSRTQDEKLSGLVANLTQAQTDFINACIAAWPDAAMGVDSDISGLLSNDPVPRLLWLAAASDGDAPNRILRLANLAAGKQSAWFALSELLKDRALSTAPNLVANSSFSKTKTNFQEPRFLYPHFGLLPEKWTLKAMPTEQGKVQLVDRGLAGVSRAVRIEGAWDTQIYQWIPVEPDCTYIATAELRGKSSPGNNSGLYLLFLDATGTALGAPRSQLLPKGLTAESRTSVVVGEPVAGASWVGIGAGCSRQSPGDWMEVSFLELRGYVKKENR